MVSSLFSSFSIWYEHNSTHNDWYSTTTIPCSVCAFYSVCIEIVGHSLGKYYSYSTGVFAHGYLRASTSETHAQVSETARTGAAAGHSGESGRERRHAPLRGALPLRGPHPYIHITCHPQCLAAYCTYCHAVSAAHAFFAVDVG